MKTRSGNFIYSLLAFTYSNVLLLSSVFFFRNMTKNQIVFNAKLTYYILSTEKNIRVRGSFYIAQRARLENYFITLQHSRCYVLNFHRVV